nr:transporter substrate-binding domain-containing protein [Paraburkholderia podalyriae]
MSSLRTSRVAGVILALQKSSVLSLFGSGRAQAAGPQTHEAIACMLPKGDAAMKTIVDRAIAKIERDGEGGKLYKTWFMSPIPPKGINLDMPMSDTMKAVFEHPNDRPMDD